MKSLYYRLSILLIPGMIFCSISSGQPRYTVIDLGTIGGSYSFAFAINDSNQVVGEAATANGDKHAFLWQNGTMTDLGTLGGASSRATGINNSTQIAGYSPTTTDPSPPTHAFLWQNGSMTDLGISGSAAYAYAINNSAQVVGNSTQVVGEAGHAFLWQNGAKTDLGTLGGSYSSAYAINNSTQIVGSSNTTTDPNRPHAFLWQNGTMTDLGVPVGYIESFAYGINNSTQVVGFAVTAGKGGHAFLWENGTMTDLGTLGGPGSQAFGINDSAQVVGAPAFLWQKGTMTDLNSLIDIDSGWTLNDARAINNQGQIVGFGIHNGQSRGFLLTPLLAITRPRAGELWIAGEQDTIRWVGGQAGQFFDIEFTVDTTMGIFQSITQNYPADSGKYVWNIPGTILSRRCAIRIKDVSNPTITDPSASFKIKGYELTRDSSGQYERYSVRLHGWIFSNSESSNTPPYDHDFILWPKYWWQFFDYSNGLDPFTTEPYPVAFRSAWSAAFLDWPLFVEVYGTSACYYFRNPAIYKTWAFLKWKAGRAVWAGSCAGLALTSSLYFGMSTQFETAFSGFRGGGSDLITLSLNDSRRTIINQLWEYQSGTEHIAFAVSQAHKTPRETLAELKSMFLSDQRELAGYLYMTDRRSAHAVNPYRLKRLNSTGLFGLFIYDNNYPLDSTKVILVDSLLNRWDYSPYQWGGQRGLYIMDPIGTYLHHPTMSSTPSMAPVTTREVARSLPYIQIYNTPKATVTITGTDSSVIGFNGTSVFNTTNGIPLIPITSTPQPPIGYYVPDGDYHVQLSAFDTSWSYFMIFGDSIIYNYERQDAQHSQTDDLTMGHGLSTVNLDSADKLIEIQTVIREDSAEKVITLNGLSLSHTDSLHVETLNSNDFRIVSNGISKSYSLELQSSSHAGSTKFNHSNIRLASNTTHVIRPAWDSLANGQVKILVDNGNDGTIDDSLFVDNQITGVRNRISGAIPNEYSLSQNYPNPFNPSTEIHYDLPKASHVKLSVFNVLGQEVAVLVDEMQDAGFKSVQWNASGLPSAVYFYRFQAGSFTETKKLLLLR